MDFYRDASPRSQAGPTAALRDSPLSGWLLPQAPGPPSCTRSVGAPDPAEEENTHTGLKVSSSLCHGGIQFHPGILSLSNELALTKRTLGYNVFNLCCPRWTLHRTGVSPLRASPPPPHKGGSGDECPKPGKGGQKELYTPLTTQRWQARSPHFSYTHKLEQK